MTLAPHLRQGNPRHPEPVERPALLQVRGVGMR